MSDQPNPQRWAQCSKCNTAAVLRRCLSMSKGWMWLWQADCKCKGKGHLVLAGADGAVETTDVEDVLADPWENLHAY